ncbi:hypothetical protein AB833_07820 [Chromatiales bacterium (ex Bugula neritina AB1)]|nr:hypothetical protein AB833_07820 [Chromatiales bacterium (ex Bugula neritina AB1)]
MMKAAVIGLLLSVATTSHSADINQQVANAYNEGLVRCSNAECAKYLYACFRSYSTASIEEFFSCGVQASRLNNDQLVILNPTAS